MNVRQRLWNAMYLLLSFLWIHIYTLDNVSHYFCMKKKILFCSSIIIEMETKCHKNKHTCSNMSQDPKQAEQILGMAVIHR